MSLPSREIECEVVVIGGGLAGAFAAHALGERGVRCVVVERDAIGRSDGASCGVHAWFRGVVPDVATFAHEHGIERVAQLDRLASESRELLRSVTSGSQRVRATASRRIVVAAEEHLESLREIECDVLTRLGIEHEVVGRDEVRTHDDATFDGADVLRCLGERLLSRRATLLEGEAVMMLESDVESVVVRTESTTVRATRAILAAGAWGFSLDDWMRECAAIGRAQEFECDELPAAGTGRSDSDIVAVGPFATAIPQADSARAIVEGRSPANRGDPFDRASDEATVARLRESLAPRLSLTGSRRSARARPRLYTCDGLPLVGPHPRRGSIVFATGFNGLDAAFAPVAGRIAAEWVTEGRPNGEAALLWSPRRML